MKQINFCTFGIFTNIAGILLSTKFYLESKLIIFFVLGVYFLFSFILLLFIFRDLFIQEIKNKLNEEMT